MRRPSLFRLLELLLWVFSMVWYAVCIMAMFFGAYVFLVGLALVFKLDLVAKRFSADAGLVVVTYSLFIMAMAVGLGFVARRFLQPVLVKLKEQDKQHGVRPDAHSPDGNLTNS